MGYLPYQLVSRIVSINSMKFSGKLIYSSLEDPPNFAGTIKLWGRKSTAIIYEKVDPT